MKIVIATLHQQRNAQAVALAAGCLKAALPVNLQADCRLIDLYPEQNDKQICELLLQGDPELISFPLYLWNQERITTLCRSLRRQHPDLRLILGGPEATPQAAKLLAELPIDAVVRGEGEIGFSEIVQALAAGENAYQIAGSYWNSRAGTQRNPERPLHERPGDWPSPWLSGILQPTADGGVLWETARGCPFGCEFCYDSGGHRRLRPFPFERLERELNLFRSLEVTQVWALDATFNHPPERGKELLRLIAGCAPDIHYHFEAKADYLDRETAALLGRLNCSVQLGLQATDPEVVRKVRRPFDVEQFRHAIHLLNSEGVTFGLDLIYGLPGDSLAGFGRSLEFALEGAPNHLDIFPLSLLPGTRLAERAAVLGIKHQSRPPYQVQETPDLSAAVDLFYNTGRAVGLLPTLLTSLERTASDFFRHFADWLLGTQGLYPEVLLATDDWQPAEVLAMQEGFVQHMLLHSERDDLLPVALDLLRYHFHHAETALGRETPEAPDDLTAGDVWTRHWRLAPGVRLVPFHYEIIDLLEMEGADLELCSRLLRPVGSLALFLRREGEVCCESLTEEMQQLLQGCDGSRTPEEIFAHTVSRAEGEELVRWVATEGVVVPG